MDTGLRRLRYFWCLSKELNFHRTAHLMGITQSSLSRSIAQLELDVGAQLFERSNRNVSLTVAGKAFAADCDRILRELDESIDLTRKIASGYAGHLTLGYTDTVISGRLPDIVKSFHAHAPQIHIRLIQAYTDRQMEMLDKGELDVGFITGPTTRSDIQTINIQSDPLVVIFPADHPLANFSHVSLSDIRDFPFIQGDDAQWRLYNAHLLSHWKKIDSEPHIVQSAPESRAIIGLVACGFGISILPECHARMIDSRLKARRIVDISQQVPSLCAWLSDNTAPALHRFTQHVAQFANRPAATS